MIIRVLRAITNTNSLWRELVRYGVLAKRRNPREWFMFRHEVNRACAVQREPVGGPVKVFLDKMFPDVKNVHVVTKLIRPNAYSVSWEELLIISSLVKLLAPQTIFEFGTFDGRTTLHLALNAPNDALVYTLDKEQDTFDFGSDTPFFKELRVGECFISSLLLSDKIRMLTGDSLNYDFNGFRKNVDLVFIDADHSYSSVMSDSKRAFEMVRPGGLVIWHDYLTIDDVTRAIVELSKTKDLKSIRGTSLAMWQAPCAIPR